MFGHVIARVDSDVIDPKRLPDFGTISNIESSETHIIQIYYIYI